MAVHIRLARHGSKKAPFYRIVVTDHRSPRDGRFIENLGTFDPNASAKESTDPSAAVGLNVNHVRLDYWCSQGAKPSHTLQRLLKANAAKDAAAKG